MKLTKADVGREFQTRGGLKAKIVYFLEGPNSDPVMTVVRHPDGKESMYSHKTDGRYSLTGDSDYDLLPIVVRLRTHISLDRNQLAHLSRNPVYGQAHLPLDVEVCDGSVVAVREVPGLHAPENEVYWLGMHPETGLYLTRVSPGKLPEDRTALAISITIQNGAIEDVCELANRPAGRA